MPKYNWSDEMEFAKDTAKLLFIFAVTFLICWFLTGCAKPNDSTTTVSQKALNNTWVASFPAWTLELALTEVTWEYASGGSCKSTLSQQPSGDPDSGTFVFSNSTAVQTVLGMPACSQFDGTWTYDLLSDNVLVLCLSTNCVYFH